MSCPEQRRLVNALKAKKAFVSPLVEQALLHIPRESFASWLSLKEAYADEAFANPIATKDNPSTLSQPSAVARFLEGFALEPGMSVLEIGAGTGYQAALIAHIVGEAGRVVSVDIFEPLVEQARETIKTLTVQNVDIVHADGALGYPAAAPFERIVATVGLREFPWTWVEQLTSEGCIVAPLHLGGESQQHVLVRMKREGEGLRGRGLDSLDMVTFRGSSVNAEEKIVRGEAWQGGYANRLKVSILPKSEGLEPSSTQKLIHRSESTILVEAV